MRPPDDRQNRAEADKEILTTLRLGGPAPFSRLAGELPLIEWIEFRPHVPDAPAEYHPDAGPSMRFSPRDKETGHASIAGSRAEILRWAISRIREHPAYAQLQDRVHEISQLKAQF